MKAIFVALALGALTGTFVGSAPLALAQQAATPPAAPPPAAPPPAAPPPAAPMRAACASDAQTLCASTPRGPELHRCLAANMDKLSEGCKSSMGAMKAAAGEVRAACAGDFKQFCPTEQGPARMRCLRQNQEKVSPGCQSALAAMPGRGR